MAIRFYNTLTKRIEDFTPIEPPNVYMYNCGPTVYDFAHIGNFKTFLFADVLRRFLELTGHTVHQVMNITDVGHMTEDQLADGGGQDKMEAAAQRIKQAKKQGAAHLAAINDPDDPYEVAGFYVNAFLEDAQRLGMKVALEQQEKGNMPRATQYVVSHMIPMIQALLDKGHAYIADDGTVYFAVETFKDYGQLSGNTLDKLRGGAGGRVSQANQAAKRHPGDFMLWKPDPAHLMKWDSPWGAGYPGWHIECSAMSRAVLMRDVIDIHTSGEDNIFPHHECEIAQSRCFSGKESFANYWMHSRHLLVEGEKMSKSKGNFYTVRDVIEGRVTGREVDPAVLRFELIKSHYRAQSNFTKQGLLDSASAVRKIREFRENLGLITKRPTGPSQDPFLERFIKQLGDDLNTAGAIGTVFEFMDSPMVDKQRAAFVIDQMNRVLGVIDPIVTPGARAAPQGSVLEFDPDAKAAAIEAARARKDFETADRLRQELIDAGYDVKTTREGTTATRRLA